MAALFFDRQYVAMFISYYYLYIPTLNKKKNNDPNHDYHLKIHIKRFKQAERYCTLLAIP